jgi:hypothetical protein
MKTIFTLLTLALSCSSAFAADAYTCRSGQGTVEVTVLKTKLKLRAAGDAAELFGDKDISAKLDPSYKPRAEHEGSLRFEAANSCGSYDVIIDKNLVDGKKSGRLIYSQDCDSDGTGAKWSVFSCR